ncbi:MAG: 50S ribosomal protein L24 [Chthoniobacterales bacterium]|nr:50S ribosomal protein L24 [Chthoniobacterales bacterium]
MLPKKNKMHVRTGDLVQVITGNHRGAQGKVIRVVREKNQVLIENVRMIKKHLGRSQNREKGEIIEREGPIHISNVKKINSVSSDSEVSAKSKASLKRKVKSTDTLSKKSKKTVEPKQEK